MKLWMGNRNSEVHKIGSSDGLVGEVLKYGGSGLV